MKMITQIAYTVYKLKPMYYWLINITSFVATVLLLPKLQEWIGLKIAEPMALTAATYLAAYLLAAVILPHLGYWFVKSNMNGGSQ